jgi:hypothetical protein
MRPGGRLAIAAACLAIAAGGPAARAAVPDAPPVRLEKHEVTGLERTKPETLLELLPRPMPATYTPAELRELERRIRNLQLFDDVATSIEGSTLRIAVREKFSITPIVDFSTGKTLADTSLTLGAIENNIGGAGTRLGGYAKYAERSPQFGVWLTEHSYHPRRWQKEVEVFFTGSSFRFDEGSPYADLAGARRADPARAGWERTRLGGELEVKTPYGYGGALRYELVTAFYRERLTNVREPGAPGDGYFVGTASELIWDRLVWNDLVPHGIRITVELRPGIFIGPGEARHEARVEALGGIELGRRTVLAFRGVAEGVNAGNPNHSVLLGSQEGVRGLPDALLRDHAHAYANVEVRHAIELAKRWYLQPVAFVDGATFLPMNRGGTPTRWRGAWATGAGVRLIPTGLVDTVLRVDGSRLFAPSSEWFVQLGIDQYF